MLPAKPAGKDGAHAFQKPGVRAEILLGRFLGKGCRHAVQQPPRPLAPDDWIRKGFLLGDHLFMKKKENN